MMDPDDIAATVAETRANAREIERLRQRTHDVANGLQENVARLEGLATAVHGLGDKLDGIHHGINGKIAELKADVTEDLTAIRTQTTMTNGRVTTTERDISKLQGGMIVVAVGLPVIVGLVEHLF